MDSPFRPGRKPGRKARPRLTYFPSMDGRKAPPRGGLSLYVGRPALRPAGRLRRSPPLLQRSWLLSLWPRKEKVARAPSGARNAFQALAVAPTQEPTLDETRRHHRHGRHHAAGPRLAHHRRAPPPTSQRRAPHARVGLLRRAERPPRLPGGRLRA